MKRILVLVELFILSLLAGGANGSCDDIDHEACVAMAKQNENMCSDAVLATSVCPNLCNNCPMTCYNCNISTPDVSPCNTVTCGNHELCMLKKIGSSRTEQHRYMLRCESLAVCEADRKQVLKSRSVDVDCCEHDLCNKPVVRKSTTLGMVSTSQTPQAASTVQTSLGTSRPKSSPGTSTTQTSLGTSRPKSSLGTSTIQTSLGTSRPKSSLGTSTIQTSLGSSRPKSSLATSTAQTSLGTTTPRRSSRTRTTASLALLGSTTPKVQLSDCSGNGLTHRLTYQYAVYVNWWFDIHPTSIVGYHQVTVADCKAHCSNFTTCRGFNFYSYAGGVCQMYLGTLVDIHHNLHTYEGCNFYRKYCSQGTTTVKASLRTSRSKTSLTTSTVPKSLGTTTPKTSPRSTVSLLLLGTTTPKVQLPGCLGNGLTHILTYQYVVYVNRRFYVYPTSIVEYRQVTVVDCKAHCSDSPTCRGFNFYTYAGGVCRLFFGTPVDILHNLHSYEGCNFYRKYCS